MGLSEGVVVGGKYRLGPLVGEGATGWVYQAYTTSGVVVAVKVLREELSDSPDVLARFEREARAAARVGSAHVVSILDMLSLEDGRRCVVMEYLEGETLLARMHRRGRLDARELAPVAVQLAEGLARTHEAGIVHRDLTPASVFLIRTESGQDHVKILDFGLSSVSGATTKRDAVRGAVAALAYVAPEHVEGGASCRTSPSVDLYSVGVILYHALTGQVPYVASDLFDLMRRMRAGPPAPVQELAPEVEAGFAEIVDRAIEWDPRARYATARDLQTAIVSFVRGAERVEQLLAGFLDRKAARGPTAIETESDALRRSSRRMAVADVAPPSGPMPARIAPPGTVAPTRSVEVDLEIDVDFAEEPAPTAPPAFDVDALPPMRGQAPTLHAEAEIEALAEATRDPPPSR